MNNVFYVYVHRRNDTNEVFYVGKGKNRRAYSKTGRNQHWCNIVNKHGYTVEIVERELSEESAFDLEKEFIKFYRDNGHNLANISDGGEGASGCKRTESHKKAISDSQKGKVISKETKYKMSCQGIKIYCSNGMTFPSARNAAIWVRENTRFRYACQDTILRACRNEQGTAFNLVWRFN